MPQQPSKVYYFAPWIVKEEFIAAAKASPPLLSSSDAPFYSFYSPLFLLPSLPPLKDYGPSLLSFFKFKKNK